MSVGRIKNGTLIDPFSAQARAGDLWICDGKLIPVPESCHADWLFDASGMIVMPGAIDMHSHFVGPKVNAARSLNSRTHFIPGDRVLDERRPFVPHLHETGWRYAGLGYTTAFDAAVPPLYAAEARHELELLPCVDAGFFALTGNHRFMLEAVQDGDLDRVTQFLHAVIKESGAWAAKLVNPGGVEDWKAGCRDGINSLDQPLSEFNATPRQIIQFLARANESLELPHAIHVHCNRLGLPGNWQTTLDTMKSVGELRCHLAHIQFHSYRGADDEASFGSAVDPLVDYVNTHPNISVDVGQVMFGETMSMTADSALGYYLQKVTGRPWISHDTELECGCGISPIQYRRRDRIHGLQWAIGLEWMLKIQNPWQLALSTDHPNGASFLSYPQIIALLMDRDFRRQQIEKLHDGVREHSDLYEIDREYSLSEIAIITRGAPAKLLGLRQKGHLQAGADADLVIYAPVDDKRRMFEFPRMVLKGGRVILDDGEPVNSADRNSLIAPLAQADDAAFEAWSSRHYSQRR
ncbi:MAG: formylmethanofuran dehydrogenase subunit A [Planctomycetaceae bacterium]|nr:formylmethanofuran dehydrogenase subunit A [Planctomycetaceae bacterium]